MARRTSAPCPFALGTEYPALRPPWFTALALMTARIGSPSASARASGLRSAAPTPSPGT